MFFSLVDLVSEKAFPTFEGYSHKVFHLGL